MLCFHVRLTKYVVMGGTGGVKPVNRLLQKVQKTPNFYTFLAQKSYGGQLRVHAYHNKNSVLSNDTTSYAMGSDAGRT